MIKYYWKYALLNITTILVICFCVSSLHAESLSDPVDDKKPRDPTMPLHQQAAVQAELGLHLTSIAKMGTRPFAIINGRRVFEGGAIGDAIIIKINAGSVVYRKDAVLHRLKMRYSVIN
ncbi:MAG: hypothetical protein U5M23_14140 [Marinagarivorans sp.]|nr:hypothetical protein [Marinagarivorans sp.]